MDPRLIAWIGRGPTPERSKSRTKPAPRIFQGNRTIFEGNACSFPRAPPPSATAKTLVSFFLFFSEGIKSGSHEKLASRGLSEQNSRLRNFSDTILPCDPGEIRIFAQLWSFWEGEKEVVGDYFPSLILSFRFAAREPRSANSQLFHGDSNHGRKLWLEAKSRLDWWTASHAFWLQLTFQGRVAREAICISDQSLQSGLRLKSALETVLTVIRREGFDIYY